MDDPRLRRHPLGYMEAIEKPKPSELREYYAERYFQTNQGNYRTEYGLPERAYIEAKIRQKAHIVFNHRGGKPGSFLDVGCGEGFAMSYFQREGWKVEGLDYSSVGLVAMNPHLSDVLVTGDVISLLSQRINGAQAYDVIWLHNVLEHIAEPADLLVKLGQILAQDGLVVVTVPNDFSKVQELLLEAKHIDSFFWVALPDHLAYFNADSLLSIAEATGYKRLRFLADFPIDWFLLHPDSNYVQDRSRGPAAHEARIQIENLLNTLPVDAVNRFYEGMADVGLGRQITAFLTRKLPE